MHQIAGASGEITVTEAAHPLSAMACSRKQSQRNLALSTGVPAQELSSR
jgi:hypothetical protein